MSGGLGRGATGLFLRCVNVLSGVRHPGLSQSRSPRFASLAATLFLLTSIPDLASAAPSFDEIDTDGDGKISWNEYIRIWDEADFATEEIPRTWRTYDVDRDQHFSPQEFAHIPKFHDGKARFNAADANGDGRVTKDEFLAPYSSYGRLRARQQFQLKLAKGETGLSLEDFARDDADGRQSAEEYMRNAIGTQWEEHAHNEIVWHDVNGDGFLSTMEFARTPHGTRDPAELVGELDTDFNDALSLDEALAIHSPPPEPAGASEQYAFEQRRLQLENGFRALDRDHNSSLTADEQQARSADLTELLLGNAISLPPSRSPVAGHESSKPKHSVIPLGLGLFGISGLAVIGLLTLRRRSSRTAAATNSENSREAVR